MSIKRCLPVGRSARWRFALLLVGLLAAGTLLAGAKSTPAALSNTATPTPVDWTALLPEGPGKQYTAALCDSCHSVAVLLIQRRTPRGWRSLLEGMNAAVAGGGETCFCLGGPLNADEIAMLSVYLGEALGNNNPIVQLPLNVNTASARALSRLPGLSSSDIQRIIRHRSRSRFATKAQIEKVIGREKFRRIGDFLDVHDSSFRSDSFLTM